MLRKYVGLIFILLALSCNPRGKPSSQPDDRPSLQVLAVESFLADIAQHVAGERLNISVLMPLGADPHTFEPTPKDVGKIADCDVLIINGAGFEAFLEAMLQNAGGQRQIIEASVGLTTHAGREGEEAVMSPEEKAEQVCAELAAKPAEKEVIAGVEAAGAVTLHGEGGLELITLKLIQQVDGFGGFVRLEAHEAGDYLIAAAAGAVKVLAADGSEMEIEEMRTLSCAGLTQGLVLELEPGEYTLALSSFTAGSTPLVTGPVGGHHHHDSDPHFWLDPHLVIKYVENIRDGLIQADPQGKEIYTQNAAAYIARLQDLDGWIKQQVEQIPTERRLMVTNHESFGYFADRYGFEIIGTIIPSVSTGASPSAQQMARLVDHIRETRATAIFLETGSNPQLAEQVAREAGIRVITDLYTHSLSKPDGPAPTYIEMMKHNTRIIVDALK